MDKMTAAELQKVAECIQDECRSFDHEIYTWLQEVAKNCADAVLEVDAELDRTTEIIAFLERRAKLCDEMDSNVPGAREYQDLVTNSLSHLYGEKIKLVKMRSRMQSSVKEIGSYDRLIARKLTIANIKILMQTEPENLMDVMNSFVPEPLGPPVRPASERISEPIAEVPTSGNENTPLTSSQQVQCSSSANSTSNHVHDSSNANMFPMESLQSTFHQHLLTQGGNLYNSSSSNSSQASASARSQPGINSSTHQIGAISSEQPTIIPTSPEPECTEVTVPVCAGAESASEKRQLVDETPSVASGSRTTNELDSVFSSVAPSNPEQQDDEVASSVAVVEPIGSEVSQQHSDNEVELITVTSSAANDKTSADFLKLHSRTNTEICRGTPVFGFKRQSRKWMKGEVVSRTPGPEGEDLYRVKYRGSMFDQTFNQAKQIAFATASARHTFKVQTRVLARFSYDAHEGMGRLDDCPNKKTQLATGVIGELPMIGQQGQNKKSSDNKNRYLIFFDSGEVQYVPHGSVWHLFVDTEPGDVWTEFVDGEMGSFLEVYFHFYPKRFLLQDTVQGKVIKVKDYGRWSNALIAAVDCNIIKVVFDDLDGLGMKYEWIFRGSDRIETVRHHLQKMLKANPLKRTLEAESCVSVTNLSTSTKTSGKASSIRSRSRATAGQRIITISSSSEDESESLNSGNDTATTAAPIASTALITAPPYRTQVEGSAVISMRNSKSGTAGDCIQPVEESKAQQMGARGYEPSKTAIVSETGKASTAQNTGETKKSSRFFGGKKWANDFVPQKRSNLRNHKKCTPHCLDIPSSSKCSDRKMKCILQKPIFAGFERELIHTKLPVFKNDNRKVAVVYKTPCGKRLRDLNELDAYLSSTRCDLPIDTFSFDPEILNIYDSVELESDPIKNDVSNGVEQIPIRVVNNVDDSEPVFLNYILERQPSREVEAMMNTDPGFMVCCDCTDNCRDKKKCRCCQLTIETTREGRNKKSKKKASHSNAGYDHRRLTSRLEFGLFECNSRCACSKYTCYNRVVQQGVQVRLELFMTDKKGWGVRALDYIPGGTFICNYSGELMTKKAAEIGAMATGDTYLMNLDFMEQVDEQKNVDDNDNGDDEGFSDDEDAYEHDDEDDEDFIRRNRANIDQPSYGANKRKPSPGRQLQERSAVENRLNVVNLASSTEDLGLIDEEDIRPASDDDEDDDNGLMAEAMIDDDDESASGVQRTWSNDDISGGQPGRVIIKGAGGRFPRRSNELSESDQSQTRKAIFNEDSPLVLDSMRAGNIGRFINHSCEPNLFVQNVFVDNHDPRFPYVGFFVGEKCIAPGTELGWDYGYEVDSVEGKVIYCHCGAPSCQKRIL